MPAFLAELVADLTLTTDRSRHLVSGLDLLPLIATIMVVVHLRILRVAGVVRRNLAHGAALPALGPPARTARRRVPSNPRRVTGGAR